MTSDADAAFDQDFTERATAFTKLLKSLSKEDLTEEDLVALAGLLQELQEMLSERGTSA